MKYLLLVSLTLMLTLNAETVSVLNLGSLPGPMSALYKGSPVVLVMIHNETPVFGKYTVILRWTDKSGAAQTASQECTAAGVNTVCVFDVDSVAEGMPIVSWRPAPLEERR